MKITVFGAGYVGLVLATCLADVGNAVCCVDVNESRVAELKQGKCPIHEPGLEDLLGRVIEKGNLEFTTDAKYAVENSEVLFLAVSTPSDKDGSADLKYVLKVAETIGQYINGYKLVVDKSTVPIGTAEKVAAKVSEVMKQRGESFEFDVASNPEFLKEGAALDDFIYPDRIVVGTDSAKATELLHEIYRPFCRQHDVMITMDIRSAELTKYVSNSMLATKISFMNEMANIAELVNADIEKVRIAVGADSRIGYPFIFPGCGYGGSCFPKDLRALSFTAKELGYEARILNAVQSVNEDQKQVLLSKILSHFDNDVKGKTIALWGLSFKPKTDDIREASSCVLIDGLLARGATVQAYDPEAMENIRQAYPNIDALQLLSSPEAVLDNASALVVVTEWTVFRSPDFALLKDKLLEPVVFDGRNVYDPDIVNRHGLHYYSIGRKPLGVSS